MFTSRVDRVIHRHRVRGQKESGIVVRRLNAHNFYRDYFLYTKLVFLCFEYYEKNDIKTLVSRDEVSN